MNAPVELWPPLHGVVGNSKQFQGLYVRYRFCVAVVVEQIEVEPTKVDPGIAVVQVARRCPRCLNAPLELPVVDLPNGPPVVVEARVEQIPARSCHNTRQRRRQHNQQDEVEQVVAAVAAAARRGLRELE